MISETDHSRSTKQLRMRAHPALRQAQDERIFPAHGELVEPRHQDVSQALSLVVLLKTVIMDSTLSGQGQTPYRDCSRCLKRCSTS